MRVCICSMGYTGYAAACWRALSALPDMSLVVFTPETHHGYSLDVLSGIDVRVFSDAEFYAKGFERRFADMVVVEKPDAVLIGGWTAGPFVHLVDVDRLSSVRKLLSIDTMWEWTPRCLLSRFRLRGFVKKLDGIIVAGERGRTFARYIGFKPSQIFTSIYGYDAEAFGGCYEKRVANWPRRFVFVGRFVPIKGIDTLIAAYRKYRHRFGEDAWELHCFGKGPLESQLNEVPGIVNRGFLQPKDLPAALTEAGVFVLPSIKDPWGVALAEGAGAGLPLIASDEVSSSVDVLRHMYNGCVVPAGDVDRLFHALSWMHEHYELLPEMGRRSKVYAGAYAPDVWANRILEAARA